MGNKIRLVLTLSDKVYGREACQVLQLLAQAVGVAVGRNSGSQLATTLVATISVIIFSDSPSLLKSKNLCSKSLSERP